MKAMLFIREVGQTKFVQENGLFEDQTSPDIESLIVQGHELAYAKGEDMCVNGSVEAFQVWGLEGEYTKVTKIEVQSA